MKLRWRFGIIAGLFLAVFSLYPQFKLIYTRGADWNGHYAYNDIDEVAYAAYLKALIDGRPRKNDPYTGRDDSSESPQPESLFSIQFAGPYTIAIPARILGVGAPWAMTISGAVASFLTALAIFWLLGMVTGDSLFAMAGSLFVLCGGALFAGEGAIGEIFGTGYSYPYFPGFRRYIPAMAFPAFFFLVAIVWKLVGGQRSEPPAVTGGLTLDKALSDRTDRQLQSPIITSGSARGIGNLSGRRQPPATAGGSDPLVPASPRLGVSVSTVVAAIAFGYTVFSYFYVWTTAAAWLACFGVCLIITRPDGVWRDLKWLAGLGVGCVLFLVPYAYMLSKRSHTMDDVQMLVRTRMPDLTRVPELIGFAVLIVIAAGIVMKMLSLRDRGTLFAISLALTPIVAFNQQIATGQSLQPIHYQVFIGNYVAGLAVVVTLGLIWRTADGWKRITARIALASLALIAAGWGFVECHYTVRVLDDVNIIRDEAFPVAKRLAEIGKNDPDVHKRVVLHLGIAEADDLPTVAPQSVLWARHQHIFAGVTWQENKERYYQQLYYQGVSPRQLADAIKSGDDFVSMIALFGWGRHTDRLNSEYKPLTFGEIDDEARKFDEYVNSFDAARSEVPTLDYLITPTGFMPYFENIDKWYTRDTSEIYGKYVLYKLTRR